MPCPSGSRVAARRGVAAARSGRRRYDAQLPTRGGNDDRLRRRELGVRDSKLSQGLGELPQVVELRRRNDIYPPRDLVGSLDHASKPAYHDERDAMALERRQEPERVRYLRWFRNEYGATPSTLRDYEAVLARMSLTLADKEPIDVPSMTFATS